MRQASHYWRKFNRKGGRLILSSMREGVAASRASLALLALPRRRESVDAIRDHNEGGLNGVGRAGLGFGHQEPLPVRRGSVGQNIVGAGKRSIEQLQGALALNAPVPVSVRTAISASDSSR